MLRGLFSSSNHLGAAKSPAIVTGATLALNTAECVLLLFFAIFCFVSKPRSHLTTYRLVQIPGATSISFYQRISFHQCAIAVFAHFHFHQSKLVCICLPFLVSSPILIHSRRISSVVQRSLLYFVPINMPCLSGNSSYL